MYKVFSIGDNPFKKQKTSFRSFGHDEEHAKNPMSIRVHDLEL